MSQNFVLNFYCIAIKKNFKGKLKYGQNYYDFDEGVMSFISPNQLLSKTTGDDTPVEGFLLGISSGFYCAIPFGKEH